MKLVLAFDSFKGALSALEVCDAAARGVARLQPAPVVIACPLSDGGDGFGDAMRVAGGGVIRHVEVTGPDFVRIVVELVLLDDGATAVVESAQACGLTMLTPGERNPRYTTTMGVGEMIAAAVLTGVRRIVVGLGGSATNDGGMGMLSALGWRFLDATGAELPPIGESLGQVARIEPGATLAGIEIVAACDVTNPLTGPHGASLTFGPQKGASLGEARTLDHAMRHYADIVAATLGYDRADVPGTGAAGGLGFALLAGLHATFQPGAELAIALAHLDDHLADAALCLTGEGRTDSQTAYGKLPAAVAAHCQRAGVPCVCLSGALMDDWRTLYDHDLTAAFSISQHPQELPEALAASADALADSAEAVARVAAALLAKKSR